jgi:hypothetical protein
MRNGRTTRQTKVIPLAIQVALNGGMTPFTAAQIGQRFIADGLATNN